jgi:hypothetical protein
MREPLSFRRFSRLFTGPVLIVSLFFAGCNRHASTSSDMSMSWAVTPKPARVGHNEFTLSLSEANAKPVTGARIQLEADMAHPGMAPVFSDVKEIAPGEYQGSVDLTMPGDWVLLVHGKLADGEKLERQVELDEVEAK